MLISVLSRLGRIYWMLCSRLVGVAKAAAIAAATIQLIIRIYIDCIVSGGTNLVIWENFDLINL